MRFLRSSRNTVSPAIVIAVALIFASCVYFNTMYNARKLYSQAEESREASGEGRSSDEKYKEVVVKCSRIIMDNPESSWVDDAIMLMGQALVRQKEYAKGIRKFQELLTNYPESEHVPAALYWLALANYEEQDFNEAKIFADRFLKSHSGGELRHDMLFLAGDIELELANDQQALSYYSAVATEAEDREIIDEALLKSADLHYRFKDWEKAAASYKVVLHKGIPWQRKFTVSLALGDCYNKTGRCSEALEIFEDLLPEAPKITDQGPVMLGRAAAYVCMDSLWTAIDKYREITKKFPKSVFSAEAYFRIGIIYHESLDSLETAQEAFAMVSNEYSGSDFAPYAIQKSGSIKRLLELQKTSGGEQSAQQQAEKRFIAAEIQLTRLEETQEALGNYAAVIDSFPRTKYAPMAGYAIAWIYQKKLEDSGRALGAYRDLIIRYPRSLQARGALEQIYRLGNAGLGDSLTAYIDSAPPDTLIVEAPPDTSGSPGTPAQPPGPVNLDPAGLMKRVKEETRIPLEATGDTLGPIPLPMPLDTSKTDTLRTLPGTSKVDTTRTLPGTSKTDTMRARDGKEAG